MQKPINQRSSGRFPINQTIRITECSFQNHVCHQHSTRPFILVTPDCVCVYFLGLLTNIHNNKLSHKSPHCGGFYTPRIVTEFRSISTTIYSHLISTPWHSISPPKNGLCTTISADWCFFSQMFTLPKNMLVVSTNHKKILWMIISMVDKSQPLILPSAILYNMYGW
jgi:hypothetical protein